jgi:hypothetical protein
MLHIICEIDISSTLKCIYIGILSENIFLYEIQQKKENNNMNCNYDCHESLSLSSNDCHMKDVTVLIFCFINLLNKSVSF